VIGSLPRIVVIKIRILMDLEGMNCVLLQILSANLFSEQGLVDKFAESQLMSDRGF
jgi:hypothetical protein